jgi:ATP-dependent Clp protease protease subunit
VSTPLTKAAEIATAFRLARGTLPLAKATPQSTKGSLYVYEPIGESLFFAGLTAKSVVEELDKLQAQGVNDLSIYMNSEGGDVFAGKAIYAAISRFPGTKTTYVDGIAASIASVIALAADKVVMAPAATMMVHRPFGGAVGRADDLRAMADLLDLEEATLVGIYAAKTKASKKQIREWLDAETFMNATTAVERGFADEIVTASGEAAPAARASAAASSLPTFAALAEETHQRIAASASRLSIARMSMHLHSIQRASTPEQHPVPARGTVAPAAK